MSASAATGGIVCGDAGCVPLSAEVATEIWRVAKASQADRVARIPDEASALRAMFDGWARLKEMGWREATYAPKNIPLELIEVGSTGVHHGYRDEIGFWIQDTDTWPSRATLFRLAPSVTSMSPRVVPLKTVEI